MIFGNHFWPCLLDPSEIVSGGKLLCFCLSRAIPFRRIPLRHRPLAPRILHLLLVFHVSLRDHRLKKVSGNKIPLQNYLSSFHHRPIRSQRLTPLISRPPLLQSPPFLDCSHDIVHHPSSLCFSSSKINNPDHPGHARSQKLPLRNLTVFVQSRGVDHALEEECGAYI
jgi:hypothetical protein